jgi:hypothetical protein
MMNISHSTDLNCGLWVLQAKGMPKPDERGARCADDERPDRTIAGAIREAQCRRVAKEDLILEDERTRAISREACPAHRTIAEAIWHGRAALMSV